MTAHEQELLRELAAIDAQYKARIDAAWEEREKLRDAVLRGEGDEGD